MSINIKVTLIFILISLFNLIFVLYVKKKTKKMDDISRENMKKLDKAIEKFVLKEKEYLNMKIKRVKENEKN